MLRQRNRRLIVLTLLIWLGAGLFLFMRCGSEQREIVGRANRLRDTMAAVFSSAAKRLLRERGVKKLRLLIGRTGSRYAAFLKEMKSLDRKLFWASLDEDPVSRGRIRSLSNARFEYRMALQNRRRK